MQVISYPSKSEWGSVLQRPVANAEAMQEKVRGIVKAVQQNGDKAIRQFMLQFDGFVPDDLRVQPEEINAAAAAISNDLKEAIVQAIGNINAYHSAQLKKINVDVETQPGVRCWQRSLPIQKVGLYIPGGTAPLFSTLLMLGIPATLAGCEEIIVCTPADKQGNVHPAILYTASVLGLQQIYKVGGAQAIAGMAYGTETIPQVSKIFGPGNQYVTAAKQLVQSEGVAIDMPAGPSEVCVLADETADASFIAADLLSQAEHGVDSQVLLVTTSASLIDRVNAGIAQQLEELPRAETARGALKNSKAVLLNNIGEAIALVNEYAAEHLIICCADEESIAEKIVNAGSVFLGNYSPESAGDYASGTNHTLPTNGYAKAYSGVSVDAFMKKISYQRLSKEGLLGLSDTIITMAEAEGLQAHANAVKIRL